MTDRSPRRAHAGLAAVLAAAVCLTAAPAHAADAIDRQRAVAIADQTAPVREELARDSSLTRVVGPCVPFVTRTGGDCGTRPRVIVSYRSGGDTVAEVQLDASTGAVLEAWNGVQAEWDMARGYDGAFGGKLNALYVWLPLCVLFFAPFFDWRRPLRLLHFDLLALLALSVSLLFFNRGEIDTSVPLVYPALVYLLARLLIAGWRAESPREALVPRTPDAWLVAGLAFLVVFRIGLNLGDSRVLDVGQQSVLGAEQLAAGGDIYSLEAAYGPVTYLAYLPFELVFSADAHFDGAIDFPAAHAAAITFDLLTIGALLLLGRRLRDGTEGRRLGLVLAYGWAACPFTAFVLMTNANDGLVALLIAAALIATGSAAARGALIALAAGAKFAPAALVPAFAAGTGARRLRGMLLFGAGFAGMLALCVVPLLPDAGLSAGVDGTIGYQASRSSPFSIWGQHTSLEWLQTAAKVGVVALGVLVGFLPRRRSWPQVAALGAAVLIGTQLVADHWFYTYVVWFLPLLLAALFAPYSRVFEVGLTRSPQTAAFAPGAPSSRPSPPPLPRGPRST